MHKDVILGVSENRAYPMPVACHFIKWKMVMNQWMGYHRVPDKLVFLDKSYM